MAVRVPGQSAACADANPELFFPAYDSGRYSNPEVADEPAKDFCRRCPVLRACLRWSLTHNERGIWGGTNEVERRALKRRIANLRSQEAERKTS